MSVDLERQHGELVALRARILAAAVSVEHDLSIDEESGEIAAARPEDIADHATDTFDRELDDTLEENAEQMLREIDDALDRMAAGTYGVCAACGKPIPAERLEAVPYATLCIEDRKRQERA
jgi:DnaK suppressor protein